MLSGPLNSPLVPASPSPTATNSSAKLGSSASEFESMLLTTWLRSAETSFGSVPGADDDEQDSAGDQIKDFASQQLATAWTHAGGIGLAHRFTRDLEKAEGAHTATPNS